MTTEALEQLMKAHKCGFAMWTCDDGYGCELYDRLEDGDVVGQGIGPSIVEAVYEALKSKCGDSMYSQKELQGKVEWIVSSPEAREIVDP